jgi:hypothetical protein
LFKEKEPSFQETDLKDIVGPDFAPRVIELAKVESPGARGV